MTVKVITKTLSKSFIWDWITGAKTEDEFFKELSKTYLLKLRTNKDIRRIKKFYKSSFRLKTERMRKKLVNSFRSFPWVFTCLSGKTKLKEIIVEIEPYSGRIWDVVYVTEDNKYHNIQCIDEDTYLLGRLIGKSENMEDSK